MSGGRYPMSGGRLMLTTALLHFAQDRRQHRKRGWRRVGPRTQVAAARRQPSLPGSNNGDGAAVRWTGRLGASDPAAVPAADGTPTTSGACTATRPSTTRAAPPSSSTSRCPSTS
ncbi:hypothetical protein PVAP13_6NG047803 [Panicum virgatum]|uniref:Uncharacterized protein n=1 Tax=Panicum virgatum TaxID=38727 RepID=A0A8T0QXX0_PANVG|nr:hypothetical protein PVAP13_6NG047803 [Panicum virgatum]